MSMKPGFGSYRYNVICGFICFWSWIRIRAIQYCQIVCTGNIRYSYKNLIVKDTRITTIFNVLAGTRGG